MRTSEPPRLKPLSRLRELGAAREILGNLIRKEVKVKYTSSVLGAAWSMLNPVLYLAVFSLVFAVVLRNDLPHLPVYLLSGLLAWNLFATSLGLASRSVVDNANLVTKVVRSLARSSRCPRSARRWSTSCCRPSSWWRSCWCSATGSAASRLLLLPLAMLALLLFTSALAFWVSGLNVRYRDTQHLLGLALLAWFWVTPVVYASGFVYERLTDAGTVWWALFLANPMADVVMGFQRALYGTVSATTASGTVVQVLPPLSLGEMALLLGAVCVGSLVLLALAWRTFFHLSGDFAEEL